MCGRYARRSGKKNIAENFNVTNGIEETTLAPYDYNIAPTTFQPVIRNNREGDRELLLMRWGLVPYSTQKLSDIKGISTINARSEGIATNRTWSMPFKKRRCLIPADAFYEWHRTAAKTSQPYVFTLPGQSLFAFAGLWDAWRDPHGNWLQSFTIITTQANALMSQIHTRMPVILQPNDYDRWLSRDEAAQPPLNLLASYASEAMEMRPANPLVNNARNNGPELLIPVS